MTDQPTLRDTRCEHGIRWPHQCDDCDEEALKPHNLIARIEVLEAERDEARQAWKDATEGWDMAQVGWEAARRKLTTLRADRDAVIEECAKVAENWNDLSPFNSRAKAIRQLKDKP